MPGLITTDTFNKSGFFHRVDIRFNTPLSGAKGGGYPLRVYCRHPPHLFQNGLSKLVYTTIYTTIYTTVYTTIGTTVGTVYNDIPTSVFISANTFKKPGFFHYVDI